MGTMYTETRVANMQRERERCRSVGLRQSIQRKEEEEAILRMQPTHAARAPDRQSPRGAGPGSIQYAQSIGDASNRPAGRHCDIYKANVDMKLTNIYVRTSISTKVNRIGQSYSPRSPVTSAGKTWIISQHTSTLHFDPLGLIVT